MRSVLAFLASPAPAALLHAILVALWPRPGAGINQHPASMFVVICLFHYALGLVLGVPLYLALRKRRSQRVFAYALAGTAIVLIPLGILIGWTLAHRGMPLMPTVNGVLRFGFGGLLTGATFWFVARPDRRVAKTDETLLSGTFG